MGNTKKHRIFLVSFFHVVWNFSNFKTFDAWFLDSLVLYLHNQNPLKYIWLFMTLFYTQCALCLLMISNWFFMHRQARMKALQATFPDVQEDEEFKIGKRFNFPKPISEPPSPTSTRGMLYIKVSKGFWSITRPKTMFKDKTKMKKMHAYEAVV